MKKDLITETVFKDPLILQYGKIMFDQYDVHQVKYIRQSMRRIARLLLKLKELHTDSENEFLSSFIRPLKFSLLVEAVRLLATEERHQGCRIIRHLP